MVLFNLKIGSLSLNCVVSTPPEIYNRGLEKLFHFFEKKKVGLNRLSEKP